MVMSPRFAEGLAHEHFPLWRAQRAWAMQMDFWIGGDQGNENVDHKRRGLFVPNHYRQTEEHADLSGRAYSPWAMLVIDTLAQTMFLEGVRAPGKDENLASWAAWQANNWDGKQAQVYRGALGHGVSYASSLPGKDRLTGNAMPRMKAYSAKRMTAFYDDEDEEFPTLTIDCLPRFDPANGMRNGWYMHILDDEAKHYLEVDNDGESEADFTYVSYETHGAGVTPVVKYANQEDLDGYSVGEIEPVIPILRRIDQDTYDRLIVQRYGAWKVRYVTGLTKPEGITDEQYRKGLMDLKVQDLLAAPGENTKFGTLDETQLAGFIAARDADIRDLAAIKQIPPHHMLGTTPQMQPESLASVNSSLMARSLERRTSFGESHERLFRLNAVHMGNAREASAYDMQTRWRDTETRSLSQTIDALGKAASQLKIPVEMLWERIEGWTDSDSQRAKELLDGGVIDALLAEMEAAGTIAPEPQLV